MKYKVSVIKKIAFLVMTMALAVARGSILTVMAKGVGTSATATSAMAMITVGSLRRRE